MLYQRQAAFRLLCRVPASTAEPEPPQKFRRQQRDVVAGGAIDLDETAPSEVFDPSEPVVTQQLLSCGRKQLQGGSEQKT
jgi:hypothetical protein